VSRPCDACGDEHDNKAPGGTYRDKCNQCMRDAAVSTRHVDQCSEDDCPVCRDYAADELVGRDSQGEQTRLFEKNN